MAQVPGSAFAVVGPWTVYTSPSGAASPITGIPYLGGVLHVGDYVDVTAADIADYQVLFGSKLYPGRYRFVGVSPNATAANIAYGKPVGYALGTQIANAVIAAAGSGYTITATGASSGTVSITSSAAGGTAATANLVIVGGVLTSAQVTYPGANMTSVPTFTLSSVLSSGSGGSLVAEQGISPNFVSSFDSSCAQLSTVRGVALTTITAAQVSGYAWMWIQELGIAPIYVTTATNTAAGCYAAATTGAAVTTTTAATAVPVGYFADTIDIAAASAICRGILRLPVQQG